MQITDRKSALLSAIIKEHVDSGTTVASKTIVDKQHFKLSPATIRNEMMALEKEGFIYQPHTSAGRIPTEKGWKHYIEHYLQAAQLTDNEKATMDIVWQEQNMTREATVKQVAKRLAAMSQDAVFVGFTPDNFYYTGLSNLFRQPEFQKIDLVCHISEVVEHLDETIRELFDELATSSDTKILVGSDNPFGKECGTLMISYADNDEQGVMGILGPMRMDYENNLALINYARELVSNV